MCVCVHVCVCVRVHVYVCVLCVCVVIILVCVLHEVCAGGAPVRLEGGSHLHHLLPQLSPEGILKPTEREHHTTLQDRERSSLVSPAQNTHTHTALPTIGLLSLADETVKKHKQLNRTKQR